MMGRILPVVLVLFASSAALFAQPSLVANTHAFGPSTTSAAINTTGATLFIAWQTNYGGAASAPTCSPACGTWVTFPSPFPLADSAMATQSAYYICGPTTSSSQTFTTFAGNDTVLNVQAYEGTMTSSCYCSGTANQTASSSSVASQTTGTTGTLCDATDLIVSAWGSNGSISSITVSNSLSIFTADEYLSGANELIVSAYIVASSTGAYNVTWTPNSSQDMVTGIAAFRPPASASYQGGQLGGYAVFGGAQQVGP